MDRTSITPDDIKRLAKDKGYVIIAHNYQIPELQKIADIVGDSLQLAVHATKINTGKILFLGVDFMAEMIKVLNPHKKVIVPDTSATCPMAGTLSREDILSAKDKYTAPFVAYVNSTLETKALADLVCTSANAVDVVSMMEEDTVLFGPDKNLASFVREKTGKNIIPVPGEHGFCYVHDRVLLDEIRTIKMKHPDALIMAHPEVHEEIRRESHFVGSTSQMEKYPEEADSEKFIVVTEIGMVEKLRNLHPGKEFFAVDSMVCTDMKLNSIGKTFSAISEERNEVFVDEELVGGARRAVERMFDLMRSFSVKK